MATTRSYGAIVTREDETLNAELGLLLRKSEVRFFSTGASHVLTELPDHLSNERTFLSSLKFSLFLGIIGLAAFIDFRLPATTSSKGSGDNDNQRGDLFFKSKGLALLFFGLAFSNLALSTINYYQTQRKYVASHVHVAEHWGLRLLLVLTGASIIGSCFLLIKEDR